MTDPRGRRALALGALFAGLAAAPAPAQTLVLERFVGRWVRTEVAHDDAARDAEIVRATVSMSFLVRSFARSVMRGRMRPTEAYTITLDGDALRVRSGDVEHAPLRPDGRLRRSPEHGEVTDRPLSEGRIERTWSQGKDGHGTVIFELSPDGERLLLHTSAENPHLDRAVVYTTRYARSGAATAAP